MYNESRIEVVIMKIKNVLLTGDVDELINLGVKGCMQCGLCSYVCPSKIDLTYSVGQAKQLVMKLGRK